MPKIVGIRFRRTPKVYYFAAGDYEYTVGGGVIAETARGTEYGTVAFLPREATEEESSREFKPILRLSTPKDDERIREQEERHGEIMRTVAEKVEKFGLKMKPVDAEYTFDGSKLVIYFTAESRVDFRDLVKELASTFRIRIELRQISARDECKMLGGIAPCGRACCCSDHMNGYSFATIKMAKNQNLPLNPAKISGLCGRLMCCLAYENAHYAETNKRMPKMNSEVTAPDGRKGTVAGINQLKETVRVKFEDKEKEKIEFEDFPVDDLKFKRPAAKNEPDNDPAPEEIKNLVD